MKLIPGIVGNLYRYRKCKVFISYNSTLSNLNTTCRRYNQVFYFAIGGASSQDLEIYCCTFSRFMDGVSFNIEFSHYFVLSLWLQAQSQRPYKEFACKLRANTFFDLLKPI